MYIFVIFIFEYVNQLRYERTKKHSIQLYALNIIETSIHFGDIICMDSNEFQKAEFIELKSQKLSFFIK